MEIVYLCPSCSKTLGLNHTISAVNEVGRKYCEHCDSNENNLDVVGKSVYESKFIECPGCSEAGGAGMSVKHLPPVCE
ncbi:hypothetical protein KAR91_55615 [Candidatus Pacearchaeota archaeon]|nr:hypothetical protein [Candidatus Pacearchaeota archaeon]